MTHPSPTKVTIEKRADGFAYITYFGPSLPADGCQATYPREDIAEWMERWLSVALHKDHPPQLTDGNRRELARAIATRVYPTICQTFNSRGGMTVEGRISAEDFNTLMKLLGVELS